ncbi:HTH-type transcriptional repressor of iron proteins A [Delftia tsuruhatensis]|uniref:AraC family transcriptional regulator n=1 Tax=Delftia tsuruhatensis TaxID=180282 RepID=UPI001E816EFB|nr:helix-turn-helix transcriptional regulator [Delftia tsuruhatensis]CAB5723300.1 HTH-type transcriptional repressor of iron proteins A [Delftia tsuruhatensis]CAC9691658.1 HTH-type transcriptional repressor of iron proteins A [Delftia tsuruhatensis]
MPSPSKPMRIQNVEDVPGDYFFRYDEFGAHTEAPPHSHSWGHLNYVPHGSMRMETLGVRWVAPPQYGIWIPPGVVHSCYVAHAVVYRSVYLAPALCGALPGQPCSLRIGAIIKAILADFAVRDVHIPASDADLRLARVLYDQLLAVPVEPGYLPAAQHPALVEVLSAMRAAPHDHRSLAQWAASVHMTERTLARHCQRELGMGLGEWRQRMRYLQAIDALEAGLSVQQIAYDLGYSTPSAFIAMFQREAGTSPEQFRREFCTPP